MADRSFFFINWNDDIVAKFNYINPYAPNMDVPHLAICELVDGEPGEERIIFYFTHLPDYNNGYGTWSPVLTPWATFRFKVSGVARGCFYYDGIQTFGTVIEFEKNEGDVHVYLYGQLPYKYKIGNLRPEENNEAIWKFQPLKQLLYSNSVAWSHLRDAKFMQTNQFAQEDPLLHQFPSQFEIHIDKDWKAGEIFKLFDAEFHIGDQMGLQVAYDTDNYDGLEPDESTGASLVLMAL